MEESSLTNITKKEILITLTSFSGAYTLLVYCFSMGYYDSYSLPSIYYSLDTGLLMNNGILLLTISSMLVLPYILLRPIIFMLNEKISNTNFYNDTKEKIPDKF